MIGIPFLLYNKVIDADCKSAEHKRLGHFLMPDCKSGRTPNGRNEKSTSYFFMSNHIYESTLKSGFV